VVGGLVDRLTLTGSEIVLDARCGRVAELLCERLPWDGS